MTKRNTLQVRFTMFQKEVTEFYLLEEDEMIKFDISKSNNSTITSDSTTDSTINYGKRD
jgi:hypothetical protein